jgi:hypothetical protein
VLAFKKISKIELITDNFTKTCSLNSCQLIKKKSYITLLYKRDEYLMIGLLI